MHGLASLITAGGSPHRFRATLQRATHALRAAAAAPRATHAVGKRVPASLLGSELADTMGESLRRALRFWEADSESEAPPSRQPSQFIVASPPESHAPHPPAIDPPSERTKGHANVDIPLHSNTWRPEIPRSPIMPDLMHGSGVARTGAAQSSKDHTNRRLPAPASPLFSVLRAYWSTVESRPAAPNDRRITVPDELAVVVPEGAGGISIDQRPFRPPMSMDVGRRLASPTDNGRTIAALKEPEIRSAANVPARPEPHPEGPDRVDWLTGDLSDQLADVLRDQAIRHGVDLT